MLLMKMFMRGGGLARWLAVAAILCTPYVQALNRSSAPTPQSGDAQLLVAGQGLSGDLKLGTVARYRFDLQAKEYAHIEVEQRGVDVVLTLHGPDGAKLIEMDGQSGSVGIEEVAWRATKPGTYVVEIKPSEKETTGGSFEVRLRKAQIVTVRELAWIAAESLYADARRLQQLADPLSLVQAHNKYADAAGKWHQAGARKWEGQALDSMGSVFRDLGIGEEAIKNLEQALVIRRETHDRIGEARTLNNLGDLYSDQEYEKARQYFTQALTIARDVKDRSTEARVLVSLGLVSVDLDQKEKARDYLEQGLLVNRERKDRQSEARTLLVLGDVNRDLNEYQKARDYLEQAVAAMRETRGRKGEEIALNDLAAVYGDLGELDKSRACLEQAVPILLELKDKEGEAETLAALAVTYVRLELYEKARDTFARVLALDRELKNKHGEGLALYHLGTIYLTIDELEQARDHFEQALLIVRGQGDTSLEAATLINLASVYSPLGQNEKALSFSEQALVIYRNAHNKEGEVTALNNLGALSDSLGRYDKARDYLQEALKLDRELKDRSNEGKALMNLGNVYLHLSELETASVHYEQAVTIFRELKDRRSEGDTLNNLGLVYHDLAQYEKARQYQEEALAINRELKDRRGEGGTLGNLGDIYRHLGQYEKASQQLERAVAISRELKDRYGEEIGLGGLGRVYDDLNQPEKALACFEQSMMIAREIKDREGEATGLLNLGSTSLGLNRYEVARGYLEKALAITREIKERDGEASALHDLMQLWQGLKQPRIAIFYGKQAVNVVQEIRGNIRHLEKESQETFLKAHEDTYRDLADILIASGRLPEAEQVLSMLKEEEFFDFVRGEDSVASALLKRATLTSEEQDALKHYNEIADRLTALGSEYAALDEERKKAPPDKVFARQARLDELDKLLSDSREAFRVFLDSLKEEFGKRDERVAEVESGLQKDLKAWGVEQTAVISTIVGEHRLNLIVTTANAQRAHTIEINSADLNRLVEQFRQAVTNPKLDPRPAGQKLYDLLVKPIEGDLQGINARTLVWSLDGTLRYVPVAALYDGKQGYLAERYQSVIITLASRTRLAEQASGKNHWQALGAGVSRPYENFAALNEVPAELRGIIRQRGPVPSATTESGVIDGRRLLDEQFTLSAFKTYLGRYPIVHIASHFSFQPGNESNSFLLLGAGTAAERRLTIATIRKSNTIFNGVELLTLSACDTATGGVGANGKEIESFGVIAQEQGAKAVMATLWPVADPSTRELMVTFYQALSAAPNISKVEALRQAQLSLLRGNNKATGDPSTRRAELVQEGAASSAPAFTPDPNARYAHPYYWAPFILIGNWK